MLSSLRYVAPLLLLFGVGTSSTATTGAIGTATMDVAKHQQSLSLETLLPSLQDVADFVETLRVSESPANAQLSTDYPKLLESLSQDSRTDPSRARSSVAAWLASYYFPTLSAAETADRANYTELVEKNWSQTCWLTPRSIFRPRSASEVAVAVKILTHFDVTFATRSGGHMTGPGFASVDKPGILIDLGLLTSLTVSDDRSVASVGPGLTWGNVSELLEPYGKTAVGGRLYSIGVGGFLLGGGFSYFLNKYGFGCDNVKNFEVVLGNGTIVNANAGENADLFWALKGGGSNFGIVTRFDLFTIPNQMWTEARNYAPGEVTRQVLDAIAEFQKDGELDENAYIQFISTPQVTMFTMVYAEPTENAQRPKAFSVFDGIPIMNVTTPPSNTTQHQLLARVQTKFEVLPHLRHTIRGTSSQIDAGLYKEIYDFFLDQYKTVENVPDVNLDYVIQTVSKRATQRRKLTGGNAMGYEEDAQQWMSLVFDWGNSTDDETLLGLSKTITDQWQQRSQARGSANPFRFMNDADQFEDVIASYGTENVKQLKEVSRKYDQKQVFQTMLAGGHFLPH